MYYSYVDIVNKLTDLEGLASPAPAGESCKEFSSYDRRSKYDPESDKYIDWEANDDGGFDNHLYRQEDGGWVIAEMNGPGYISRIWAASTEAGHIKIFIDGNESPVLDIPFKNLFDWGKPPFTYHSLCYYSAGGGNCYIPITYNKSCKVVVYEGFGRYYHVNYVTLPASHQVESFKLPLKRDSLTALCNADIFFQTDMGKDPVSRTSSTMFKAQIDKSEELCIFNDNSSGAVTALRIRVNGLNRQNLRDFEDWHALRELAISIHWDNEASPSVWGPLGDFFGTACGYNEFKSLPCGMNEDGWMYSLWYMPYNSAKITITNDGFAKYDIEYEITSVKIDKSTADGLLRFHAKWHRNTNPLTRKDRRPDYSLLKTSGKGRFVGCLLHVYKGLDGLEDGCAPGDSGDGWWGEGDEKFFIDGEPFPSWFGTGSEDYFGYAWALDAVFSKAYHTQAMCMGSSNRIGSRSLNRFHITDNIPFNKSFDGYIEKYYSDNFVRYGVMAYWYLDKNGADDYGVFNLEERTSYYDLPKLVNNTVVTGEELFYQVRSVTSGRYEVQDSQLFWSAEEDGAVMALYISVPEAGEYKLSAQCTKSFDYGIAQFEVNNINLNTIDLYSEAVSSTEEFDLGTVYLDKGVHIMKITMIGKNPRSSCYRFGLAYMKFIK